MRLFVKSLILIFFWTIVVLSNPPEFNGPKELGTVDISVVSEASGLAASEKNANILWTHNDNNANLFAINLDCEIIGKFALNVPNAKDVEDIAWGRDENASYLYIGDIGDNDARYATRKIYKIKEPTLNGKTDSTITIEQVETIEYAYPDGSRDAEALFVEPTTKNIYVISKREENVRVYRLKHPQSTDTITTAEFITTLPFGYEGFEGSGVTASDITRDGSEILIKTYFKMYYYKRVKGQAIKEALSSEPREVEYRPEPQGEAVCWDAGAAGYYTLSEAGRFKIEPKLYYYERTGSSVKKKVKKDNYRLNTIFANGTLTILITAKENDRATIELYNYAGAKLKTLYQGAIPKGETTIQANLYPFSSGVYFVILKANSGGVFQRIVYL